MTPQLLLPGKSSKTLPVQKLGESQRTCRWLWWQCVEAIHLQSR